MKKLLLLALISIAILAFQLVRVPNIYASSTCSSSQGFSQAECSACNGINELNQSQNCQSNGSTINNVIKTVVNVLSVLLGAVAVIMIIISGLRFATAGGNSNGISAAKSTLMWALVGLAIAVLAQVIVRWVIGTSSNVASSGLLILFHYLY
ncbi:pilin [Patescibacteria group bacterium]|nr:pilin [Patescibacteria group bacterium]